MLRPGGIIRNTPLRPCTTPLACSRSRMRNLSALFVMCAGTIVARAADSPDFIREIQPIFAQHCVKCHGAEKQKGGLRFDVKEGAFRKGESGELAIVPKRASDSRMIKLVTSAKEDEWMPPKGDRLTSGEIDLLKRW